MTYQPIKPIEIEELQRVYLVTPTRAEGTNAFNQTKDKVPERKISKNPEAFIPTDMFPRKERQRSELARAGWGRNYQPVTLD
ncbi:MAG: hypothetical protein ABH817_00340 [archaeon]